MSKTARRRVGGLVSCGSGHDLTKLIDQLRQLACFDQISGVILAQQL